MQVETNDVLLLCDVIRELCGVALDERKTYLIENRLSKIAESAGCSSFADLTWTLRHSGSPELKTDVIDAITTGETLFFRDRSPFDALQHKVLPNLIDSKANTAFPKRIRIWSTASSTGQEPYSIAMTIRELIPDVDTWNISIVATDISTAAIAYARRGDYNQFEVDRGLSPQMREKHFDEHGGRWRIKDEVREMVSFEHLDLTQTFQGMGLFDIVFARNVAIYFEKTVRDSLFRRIAEVISPNGYLFVGSSENLAPLGPQFAPQTHCRSIFYQPNVASSAASS